MNILWLYGSIPKFDAINHWYHADFARIVAKIPNINLILYGYNLKKLYPDLVPIPFVAEKTGKDLKKEFDFDVIVMDNKNRFIYPNTLKRKNGKGHRVFWLKPSFFNNLDNIPKVFLEGDYHAHFKICPQEENWYRERKIDLLLVRHIAALNYHTDKSIMIKWFPCSVDTHIFKPNPLIKRKNKICLISGYGKFFYKYRNAAGKVLVPGNYIDIYNKRFIGNDYIKNLQSYISHISGSSIRTITPAKMFEIMASGSVLFTDEGDDYGLKELFPNNSYVTYNKIDYSDIIPKARKIINEAAYRNFITAKALKCIKQKHTHKIRAKELIEIITKTFNISYKKPEDNLMTKIGDFFNKYNTTKINETPEIVKNNLTKKEIIKYIINYLNQQHLKFWLLKNSCLEAVIKKEIVSNQLHIGVASIKIKNIIINQFTQYTKFIDISVEHNRKTKLCKLYGSEIEIPFPVVSYLERYTNKSWKDIQNEI